MKRFNVKFDYKTLASIAVLAVVLTGCGMRRSGQYQGLENVHAGSFSLNSGTGDSIRTSAAISIQESKNDTVQGTWSTRYATGSFTGILKADQLQILNLSRGGSSTASGLNGVPGFAGTFSAITQDPLTGAISAICPGDYMGSLKFEGDRIVGSITPANNSMNPCSRIDIDVLKIN